MASMITVQNPKGEVKTIQEYALPQDSEENSVEHKPASKKVPRKRVRRVKKKTHNPQESSKNFEDMSVERISSLVDDITRE